ncbi:hypothetical protein FRC17_008115 [Serendipita sp. 399]|nr:hypothetical protein FRC17_008115 [Serendipita sp. 399]
MKEALRVLDTQLKIIGALDDPKQKFPFVSSRSNSGPLEDAMLLVESLQQTICEISHNLNKTLQRYATLVTSLTQRGPSMTKPSPIHRLPNEMMIEIFGKLAQDGIHSVKPLLLVNQQFSSLVASTPSLWCNINIKIDAMLQESNNLSIAYINTCIMRSQRSFLHVNVDMARCCGPCEYVASVLRVVQDEVPRFSDAIGLAIHVLEETTWDGDDAAYIRRVDEVENLVRAIVGPEGVHMRRWKSFKFSPPADLAYIGGNIWDLFQYPTPNLEMFILDGELWTDEYFDKSFPDMTALRYLTLRVPHALESVPISRHLLTAVIALGRYEDNLSALSDCGTLHELTITDVDVPWTYPPIEISERDVKLPSLRRLTIEGRVGALQHIAFRTPCLESFRLLCGYEEGIPEVRARLVEWVSQEKNGLEPMLRFLNCLMVGIKEMEELNIKCERVEGFSLAVHEITTHPDTAVVDTLRVVRIDEVGE